MKKYKQEINKRLYFIYENDQNLTFISNYDSFYSNIFTKDIKGVLISRNHLRETTISKENLDEYVENSQLEIKLFDDESYLTYFSSKNFKEMKVILPEEIPNSKIKLNSLDALIQIPFDSNHKDKIVDLVLNREYVAVKFEHEYLRFGNYLNQKVHY